MNNLSFLSPLEDVIRASDRDLLDGIGNLSPNTVTGLVHDQFMTRVFCCANYRMVLHACTYGVWDHDLDLTTVGRNSD